MDLSNCSFFVMFDNMQKDRPQIFFTRKIAFCFSKNCVFNNLLCVTEMILKLPQYLSGYLLDSYIPFHEVCHTRYNEKKRQSLFFAGKVDFFFQMFVFSTTSKVLQKNSRITQEVSKDLLDSYKVFHDNCHLGYYAKIRPQLFFTGKIAFFSYLCFQKPLRCCRNVLITSTVSVKIPFKLLQFVPWSLSVSIMREKKATKIFLLERLLFLQKFCFQQHLVVTEISL